MVYFQSLYRFKDHIRVRRTYVFGRQRISWYSGALDLMMNREITDVTFSNFQTNLIVHLVLREIVWKRER